MDKVTLNKRSDLNRPLSWAEMDNNWQKIADYLYSVGVSAENAEDAANKALAIVGGSPFAGIATPSGTPSVTQGVKATYIATEKGSYKNYGNLTVSGNELAVLYYDGTSWSKTAFVVDFSGYVTEEEFNDKLTELENYLIEEQVFSFSEDGYLNSSGEFNSHVTYKSTDFIKVNKGDEFYYTGSSGAATESVVGYDSSKGFSSILLPGKGKTYTKESIVIPDGVEYIRGCANSVKDNYFAKLNKNSVGSLQKEVESTNLKVANIESSLVKKVEISEKSLSVLPSGVSVTTDGKTLKLNPIVAGTKNIAIYIKSDYNYKNEYKIKVPYGGSEIYLIPIIKNGDIFYGIRFTGAKCALYKLVIGSGASSKVDTISSVINSFKDGDKITYTVSNNKELSLYINDSLAVKKDISSYISDDSILTYGEIVLATSTTWVSNPPVLLEDMSSSLDVLSNTDKSIVALQYDVKALASNNVRYDNRFVHFSFDDVILCFKDVTEKTPESIFDNDFFGWMKTIHDKYGTCFSCYCFYEDTTAGDFNMSTCTDAYKDEFISNSDWLKFGFHSKSGAINYSVATKESAKTDYEQLVTELVRVCGYESIDRMPRIQNYAGSKEALIGFRDAANGIVGALAAQDISLTEKRDSYYFTEEQNNFMHLHCKMYDFETSLSFVKTAYLQGGSITAKQYSEFLNLANDVEIFLHENQLSEGMKTYLETYAKGFVELGYVNTFQMYHALMR